MRIGYNELGYFAKNITIGEIPKRGVGKNFPHAFGVTARPKFRPSVIGAEPLLRSEAEGETTKAVVH